jgi:hypothetical protein
MTIRATDTIGNTSTVTRNWTIDCIPLPSSTGGFGIFHFEETSGQTAVNSRQSSLPAVLGDSASVETDDPSWSPSGRFGRALQFNYLELDDVHWATTLVYNSHLFETWINLTDSPVGAGGSTLFLSEDGRVRVWVVDVGTQYQVRYSLTNNASVVTTIVGASVSYGQWHHVLAQFGSNTMTLWVDDLEATGTAVISDAFTYGTMSFSTSADPIAGRMDEVHFALIPLTRAQARDRYCPL